MMAMAARYFQPYDAEYAQTCLDAAKLSYDYLKEHPEDKRWEQGDFQTGAYGTSDPDDRMWAAAEMWETTGDSKYLQDLEARIREYQPHRRRGEAAPSETAKVDADWDWGHVRNLAVFTYVLSEHEGRDPDLLAAVKNDIVAVADQIVQQAKNDVYGRPLQRYYWGCNGTIARQVINLQVAHKIEPKQAYLDTALDAVAHIFGRNYYNRSYVTGLGHNPPLYPHSRRSGADDVEAPWPGVYACGDWIGWPTPALWMERCTITGMAAANHVLQANGAAPWDILPPREPEALARWMGGVVRAGRRTVGPVIRRAARVGRRR